MSAIMFIFLYGITVAFFIGLCERVEPAATSFALVWPLALPFYLLYMFGNFIGSMIRRYSNN